jgi:hypothetical protein
MLRPTEPLGVWHPSTDAVVAQADRGFTCVIHSACPAVNTNLIKAILPHMRPVADRIVAFTTVNTEAAWRDIAHEVYTDVDVGLQLRLFHARCVATGPVTQSTCFIIDGPPVPPVEALRPFFMLGRHMCARLLLSCDTTEPLPSAALRRQADVQILAHSDAQQARRLLRVDATCEQPGHMVVTHDFSRTFVCMWSPE